MGTKQNSAKRSSSGSPDVPFSSNAVRLSPRQWMLVCLFLGVICGSAPKIWQPFEPLAPEADYRIPYQLSNDYWIASRVCERSHQPGKIPIIGDSVVWGHYVAADETLSHFLNEYQDGDRFTNLGIDGIHPAALLGLIRYYGRAVTGQRVILHCNLLWMSSQRHDLQTDKEFAFNHPQLVPQLYPRIPCYKAGISERLGIVVTRGTGIFAWSTHLQIAYFDSTTLPLWSMDHPYENPLERVTFRLPSPGAPPPNAIDAQPWKDAGISVFDPHWVDMKTSFQWACFLKTVDLLQRRGNHVFVVVGPFNEHMLTEASRGEYRERLAVVENQLTRAGIPHVIAPLLPSSYYADASHPLKEGYALLAERLVKNSSFNQFTQTP